MPRNTLLFAALLCTASLPGMAATAHYTIDPAHTYPSFEADHMGISVWRGKLDKSSGSVDLDKSAGTGSVDVTIDLSSIDFGLDALNTWAMGKDFFDVATFPTATYKGALVDFVNGAPTRVSGTLTLHGVSKPMDLTIDLFKCIPHPIFKRELCGADATGTFDRSAFGLTAGKDYGFRMDVPLRIQVEALKDK
ncbi:MAG TPA: YceI family protein [Luteimonas sp.]|nr:YceI family protein [Luteimonas sp.]